MGDCKKHIEKIIEILHVEIVNRKKDVFRYWPSNGFANQVNDVCKK